MAPAKVSTPYRYSYTLNGLTYVGEGALNATQFTENELRIFETVIDSNIKAEANRVGVPILYGEPASFIFDLKG